MTIRVEMTHGLGNQIFQAAAGYALARRLDCDLILDAAFYSKNRSRNFELTKLKITNANRVYVQRRMIRARRLIDRFREGKCYKFRQANFGFDPRFETLSRNTRIAGYMQSERYFAAYHDEIRDLFMPDEQLGPKTAALVSAGPYSVLHVRRGDYLEQENVSVFDFPGLEYYQEAIELLPRELPLIVVSDDLSWVKANLSSDRDMYFPGLEEPASGLQDFTILSKAQNHIIANSSFSWWGAWLGENENSISVAPKKWFRKPSIFTDDLIPQRWIRI